METSPRGYARSRELFERAQRTVPGGVGGNARGLSAGWRPHPVFIERGLGSRLWDVDGNEYVDYLAAFGPLILGHRPPAVLAAVRQVLEERGSMFGAPHNLEYEVAELAVAAVPCWEMVRFANTGSEAVMAALRLARAYTGRPKVLRFEGHYHGQTDTINWSVKPPLEAAGPEEAPVPIPATGGIPAELAGTLLVRGWNDPESLERTIAEHGHELAAVICEPMVANAGVLPPRPGYLELLRRLTAERGIVLIFDEVKTGFRLALGGAQEHYGVVPDLSTAAKAIAAGFPLAAVGGRRELMQQIGDNKVLVSATYHTHPTAMAAAKATLTELSRPGFYRDLFAVSDSLKLGIQKAADEAGVPVVVQGVGPILQVLFADRPLWNYREVARHTRPDDYAKFWQGLFARGVYCHPQQQENWFVSAAHTPADVAFTVAAAREALAEVRGVDHR